MELVFVFWFCLLWWKVGNVLDVLKEIRDILKKGSK